ncbi:MAG: outer membrane beta-barrel protein, partial [Bacteroidota bacterium]
MNLATIYGSSESFNGESLENFGLSAGFHAALSARYAFTDRLGVMGEFMFSQKGVQYRYEGQGTQILLFDNNGVERSVGATGDRRITINVTNNYIEIPIMGYFKATDNIELHFGAYAGFLVSSKATGDRELTGTFTSGATTIELDNFSQNLDFNYLSNEPGRTNNENTIALTSNGNPVLGLAEVPESPGAYFDFTEKEGNFYKGFDFGALFGVAYIFDSGLNFQLRASHSLLDQSNDFFDRSNIETAETELGNVIPVARSDRDSNLTFQFSVGFGF